MNKRLQYDVPENWGSDEITKFLNGTRQNQIATFAKYPRAVERFARIDVLFRRGIESLSHSEQWFAGVFFLRTHSNFLGACSIVWSCQTPEGYVLLRSALENALYGLYLAKNPASRSRWLNRHDSDQSKKEVREEFKINKLLNLVTDLDANDGARVRHLYDMTIDQGAHPNERAFTPYLDFDKTPSDAKITMNYLTPGGPQLGMALKATAEIGVCTLTLFERVIPERFALLGLDRELDRLKLSL